jgi:hypothetical protein
VVLEEEVENKTDVSFWLSAAILKTLSFVASAIGRSYSIEQLMKQDFIVCRRSKRITSRHTEIDYEASLTLGS